LPSLDFFLKYDTLQAFSYCFNVGLGVYMGKDQKILYKKHIDDGGKKAINDK
jgi:hypothetical protein